MIIPFFGKFLPQSRTTSSGFPLQNHCESEFISAVSENASTLRINSGLSARLTSLNCTTARGHSFSRSSRTSCRRHPRPKKDGIWRSSPMMIISLESSKRLRNNPSSACPHCESSSPMTFGFVQHTLHLAMDEGDMLMWHFFCARVAPIEHTEFESATKVQRSLSPETSFTRFKALSVLCVTKKSFAKKRCSGLSTRIHTCSHGSISRTSVKATLSVHFDGRLKVPKTDFSFSI